MVNPTWSQDSGSVAYGSTDGIHVMSVPADWSCAGPGRPAPGARRLRARLGPGRRRTWPRSRRRRPPRRGGAPAKAPAKKAGPGLAKVRLTPAKFRARAGAKLRFTLAGPAKLALTVTRASGKAVKGSIRSAGKPGANTLRFKGRIGGHTLRPAATA